MRKLKQSINQYRNINGTRYECYTTNADEFDKCKAECKEERLKYRIIEDQFYKEVKQLTV